MTAQALDIMAYPDFVASIGQENTPPGGRETVRTWSSWIPRAEGGQRVLDVACSTGFSGRAWAQLRDDVTDVVGIDLAAPAVETARAKAPRGGAVRFDYVTGDAATLPYADSSLDIVLGGCNFAFIAGREQAAAEVVRVLRPGGHLVTSNFFYEAAPSADFLTRMEKAVGFRPSPAWVKGFWDALFGRHLQLVHERVESLQPAPRPLVLAACAHSVATADGLGMGERAVALNRLGRTRLLLNRHRALQGLALQCWVKP